jgi:UDP-N-acetylmuramyl pentapeptide phosphotransferase/UDP-N-acetylglucosamine-1-phosphate transferase
MPSLSLPAWSLLALATAAISALGTWASIAYAVRREMLDLPGRRRSHEVPTPRGGGIGIVVAVIFGILACAAQGAGFTPDIGGFAAVLASIVLVALVGWVDDHRGLGASSRLIAHILAAVLLGLPGLHLLLTDLTSNPAGLLIAVAGLVAGAGIVWSINLHNFMDGINGLLSMQAVFVFAVLALICADAGRIGEAQTIALFAMATLGFIPFNFPRPLVFMGDVGSGVLGLLVAIAVGLQMAAVPSAFVCALIACSAFVVDSTATLLSRMFSGRRWYSAHREHLYQWLVRSGMSHTRVTALYMLWNLIVVLPALIFVRAGAAPELHDRSGQGASMLALVYVLALLVWILGKRFCLTRSHREFRMRTS